jgi:hypothetical protein
MATTLPIEPFNKSFLSNNKFDFVLKRIPNFTFLVQGVNLPGLTLQSSSINTPFSAVSIPGNQITFGSLSLTFMVDEDMQAWYELYDWIIQLGNPKGYNKIGNLTREPGFINSTTSDAILYVKTNSNNPNFKFNFIDVYPTELGEMNFTSSDNGQEFITSTATFNYGYYEAVKI